MEKKTIYSFKRSETDAVRISAGAFKEKEYVDIRNFYSDKKSGEWKPTKKGITINQNLLGELIEGLKRAEQELAVAQ